MAKLSLVMKNNQYYTEGWLNNYLVYKLPKANMGIFAFILKDNTSYNIGGNWENPPLMSVTPQYLTTRYSKEFYMPAYGFNDFSYFDGGYSVIDTRVEIHKYDDYSYNSASILEKRSIDPNDNITNFNTKADLNHIDLYYDIIGSYTITFIRKDGRIEQRYVPADNNSTLPEYYIPSFTNPEISSYSIYTLDLSELPESGRDEGDEEIDQGDIDDDMPDMLYWRLSTGGKFTKDTIITSDITVTEVDKRMFIHFMEQTYLGYDAPFVETKTVMANKGITLANIIPGLDSDPVNQYKIAKYFDHFGSKWQDGYEVNWFYKTPELKDNSYSGFFDKNEILDKSDVYVYLDTSISCPQLRLIITPGKYSINEEVYKYYRLYHGSSFSEIYPNENPLSSRPNITLPIYYDINGFATTNSENYDSVLSEYGSWREGLGEGSIVSDVKNYAPLKKIEGSVSLYSKGIRDFINTIYKYEKSKSLDSNYDYNYNLIINEKKEMTDGGYYQSLSTSLTTTYIDNNYPPDVNWSPNRYKTENGIIINFPGQYLESNGRIFYPEKLSDKTLSSVISGTYTGNSSTYYRYINGTIPTDLKNIITANTYLNPSGTNTILTNGSFYIPGSGGFATTYSGFRINGSFRTSKSITFKIYLTASGNLASLNEIKITVGFFDKYSDILNENGDITFSDKFSVIYKSSSNSNYYITATLNPGEKKWLGIKFDPPYPRSDNYIYVKSINVS